MNATLHYAHDPMCSWCWAFRPTGDALFERLRANGVRIAPVLGGLAPDSDEPMSVELAEHLQGVWRHIATVVPGTRFNLDFWRDNVPKRSTWRACRAVLVAERLGAPAGAMTDAIQRAYYLQARNPSDRAVLAALADELGLDVVAFSAALDDADTQRALDAQFATCARLGASGFPSLFLEREDGAVYGIPVEFGSPEPMRIGIERLIASA